MEEYHLKQLNLTSGNIYLIFCIKMFNISSLSEKCSKIIRIGEVLLCELLGSYAHRMELSNSFILLWTEINYLITFRKEHSFLAKSILAKNRTI